MKFFQVKWMAKKQIGSWLAWPKSSWCWRGSCWEGWGPLHSQLPPSCMHLRSWQCSRVPTSNTVPLLCPQHWSTSGYIGLNTGWNDWAEQWVEWLGLKGFLQISFWKSTTGKKLQLMHKVESIWSPADPRVSKGNTWQQVCSELLFNLMSTQD